MNHKRPAIMLVPVLLFLTLACGATTGVTPVPPTAGATATLSEQAPASGSPVGVELSAATFARGLTEEMQPVDPGAQFGPSQTIYLSLQIGGRPREGELTVRFLWGEEEIADASIDLAAVNDGLIFSVGQDTYAGFTLTHDEPFPISGDYAAEAYYEDEYLGSFPFEVIPPSEAIPSQVHGITLALGADSEYRPLEPTTSFTSDQAVYLVGHGDFGVQTWLQADWYIDGRFDQDGTRSLTMEENAAGTGFSFSYLPEGGWPPGEHLVILTMNDREVGRYPFEVQTSGDPLPEDEASFWDTFPLPDDAEMVPVVQPYDYGFATEMIEPELLDAYAGWLADTGWKQQAPTEAMKTLPHQVWRKDGTEFFIEIQGMDDDDRTVVWVSFEPVR